jgi:hypothetical protein
MPPLEMPLKSTDLPALQPLDADLRSMLQFRMIYRITAWRVATGTGSPPSAHYSCKRDANMAIFECVNGNASCVSLEANVRCSSLYSVYFYYCDIYHNIKRS